MTSDRSERMQELFEEALSREPADTATLLDEACGDDTELREEVESLLSHHQQAAATFMRVPDRAAAGGFPDMPRVADPLVGQDVAGYRITRRISIGAPRRPSQTAARGSALEVVPRETKTPRQGQALAGCRMINGQV